MPRRFQSLVPRRPPFGNDPGEAIRRRMPGNRNLPLELADASGPSA